MFIFDEDNESNSSMHDSSLASFVNSTHNLDFETEFEVVFHNVALTNILDNMNLADLNKLLDKPVFVNNQLQQPISLLSAAQSRYSDEVLNQVFKMQLELDITRNTSTMK